MTTFFTSDLHLFHRAVAWARINGAWPTTEERKLITPEMVTNHNNLLAAQWDATVTEHDVVWVLGDLITNAKHLPLAEQWMYERPGTKRFILGNHDPAHPMHSEAHKFLGVYLRMFDNNVQMAGKRKVVMPDGSKQTVMLSHFPYDGDGDSKAEDRDTQWRLRNEGLAVLHGHTHSSQKITWAPPPGVPEATAIAEHLGGRVQQVHVGVDAWDLTPVSLDQIVEVLDDGSS